LRSIPAAAQFDVGISSRLQDDPLQLYLAGNNLCRRHPFVALPRQHVSKQRPVSPKKAVTGAGGDGF
jgi:hypothetical protein